MQNMTNTEGFPTGCNPRTSRYGEICGKLEDNIDVITKADDFQEHINTPNEETLLRCVWSIYRQRVGSCATNSSSGAMKLVREFNGLPRVELSAESMYVFTGGGRDRGSSIDENLRHLQTTGVLPMELWPQDEHRWNDKPPKSLLDAEACKYRISEFFDISTIEEVMSALVLNMPVVFGWQSHSCVLLKLINMTSAYYLNSWGKGWSQTGMPGIGKINLRSIGFHYGAFAVRSVTDAGGAI